MTIEKLFEKWLEKEFGADTPWDEEHYITFTDVDVFNNKIFHDFMLQAFKAGRKSRNEKRSPNKNNPYKYSSSVICPKGEL